MFPIEEKSSGRYAHRNFQTNYRFSKQPVGAFYKRIYDGGWRKVNTTDNFFSVFATLAYSFKNRYIINASA